MPQIETRTIPRPKKAPRISKHTPLRYDPHAHERRHELQARYPGGPTRCTRCPPTTFCETCARINRARHHAGLLRPTNDPHPSPDNAIHPIVVGKYRGPTFERRLKDLSQPVVTAFIEHFGGSWVRGIVSLNGKRIYVGRKTQSLSKAWDFAHRSARLVKLGLQYESDLCEGS